MRTSACPSVKQTIDHINKYAPNPITSAESKYSFQNLNL